MAENVSNKKVMDYGASTNITANGPSGPTQTIAVARQYAEKI